MKSLRIRKAYLGFLLFLAGSLAFPPVWGQEIGNTCNEAIEQFLKVQSAFQALSQDCLAEAGMDPKATLNDCPSVSMDSFISLVTKMELNHDEVCRACGNEWPVKDLGEGSCLE